MKTTGFRWRVLLIPVLCSFIAMGAVRLSLSHKTTTKLRELDQSLQDPAWRDRFEADYTVKFNLAPQMLNRRGGIESHHHRPGL